MATETSATGTILRRYVRANGDDEPLVWYEGAGTTDRRWYHSDERGSIVALSDNTGAMTAINKYDEYGILGAGNIGRFQYTGQMWIAELGLYYYKARMYSPTLGKFMQTDPVEYEDGMNWYNYAGSDPINMVDPTGLGGIGTTANGQLLLSDFGNSLSSFLSWMQPESLSSDRMQIAVSFWGSSGKKWAMPNTALGLGAAGISYIAGKIQGTDPYFQIGNKAIQLINSPLNVDNRPYTLGNVQVYGVNYGPETMQKSYTGVKLNTGFHEEGHTVQSEILGIFYLPAWALGYLIGGDGPGNPLEAGADTYAVGKR